MSLFRVTSRGSGFTYVEAKTEQSAIRIAWKRPIWDGRFDREPTGEWIFFGGQGNLSRLRVAEAIHWDGDDAYVPKERP